MRKKSNNKTRQKTTNNIIQLYCNVWQTEWGLQKAVMRARQTNRKTNKLHLRTKMAIRCPGGKGWLRQWSLGGNLLFQRCSQSFFHCQDHAQKWYIYEQMLYLGNAITAKKTTKTFLAPPSLFNLPEHSNTILDWQANTNTSKRKSDIAHEYLSLFEYAKLECRL